MVHPYNGHHPFDSSTINRIDPNIIGVYYCGRIAPNGNLDVFYIGKATGQEGFKQRLSQHVNERKWSDVLHFGLAVCSSEKEALEFELAEIKRCNPKYNTVGKLR